MTTQSNSKSSKKKKAYRSLSVAVFFVFLGAWCVFTYGGYVSHIFIPSPTKVLGSLYKMLLDGSLWAHCAASTGRVVVGWFWSAAAALPIGMLMARSQKFSAVVQPLIEFIRYLPVVALVPLTILYLGIDETQKYTIIFLGTFFQLVLMVCDTVSAVDKNLLNAARTLGAKRWQIYKEVIFPAALPGLMDDFRLTIGWAWTYLVVAEMVAASNGLGFIILKSQRFLATDVIFGGLVMIGLIGLFTDWLFRLAARLIVPWHERLGD